MEDIDSAVPEDTGNPLQDVECSFIVKVHTREHSTPNSTQNIGNSGLNQPDPSKSDIATTQPDPPEISHGSGNVPVSQLGPKPYNFKASSIAERNQWIGDINSALRAYQRTKESDGGQRASALRAFQLRLQSFYTSMPFQAATAITVGLNFILTVSTSRHQRGRDLRSCIRPLSGRLSGGAGAAAGPRRAAGGGPTRSRWARGC
jgi:hypothetical protein